MAASAPPKQGVHNKGETLPFLSGIHTELTKNHHIHLTNPISVDCTSKNDFHPGLDMQKKADTKEVLL